MRQPGLVEKMSDPRREEDGVHPTYADDEITKEMAFFQQAHLA